MISELLNNMDSDFIIPTKEDMDKLVKKISNNEKLDFLDILTLKKMTFCRHILNIYRKESNKNECN